MIGKSSCSSVAWRAAKVEHLVDDFIDELP
jgi:hypothetical protein